MSEPTPGCHDCQGSRIPAQCVSCEVKELKAKVEELTIDYNKYVTKESALIFKAEVEELQKLERAWQAHNEKQVQQLLAGDELLRDCLHNAKSYNASCCMEHLTQCDCRSCKLAARINEHRHKFYS